MQSLQCFLQTLFDALKLVSGGYGSCPIEHLFILYWPNKHTTLYKFKAMRKNTPMRCSEGIALVTSNIGFIYYGSTNRHLS